MPPTAAPWPSELFLPPCTAKTHGLMLAPLTGIWHTQESALASSHSWLCAGSALKWPALPLPPSDSHLPMQMLCVAPQHSIQTQSSACLDRRPPCKQPGKAGSGVRGLTPLRLTTVHPCSSCAAAASLLFRASSASNSSVQSSRRFLSAAVPGKHALCASTRPAHNLISPDVQGWPGWFLPLPDALGGHPGLRCEASGLHQSSSELS